MAVRVILWRPFQCASIVPRARGRACSASSCPAESVMVVASVVCCKSRCGRHTLVRTASLRSKRPMHGSDATPSPLEMRLDRASAGAADQRHKANITIPERTRSGNWSTSMFRIQGRFGKIQPLLFHTASLHFIHLQNFEPRHCRPLGPQLPTALRQDDP